MWSVVSRCARLMLQLCSCKPSKTIPHAEFYLGPVLFKRRGWGQNTGVENQVFIVNFHDHIIYSHVAGCRWFSDFL